MKRSNIFLKKASRIFFAAVVVSSLLYSNTSFADDDSNNLTPTKTYTVVSAGGAQSEPDSGNNNEEDVGTTSTPDEEQKSSDETKTVEGSEDTTGSDSEENSSDSGLGNQSSYSSESSKSDNGKSEKSKSSEPLPLPGAKTNNEIQSFSEPQIDDTNFWYIQFDENSQLFISGIAELTDSLTIPENITVDSQSYPVAGIIEDAFYSFTFKKITFETPLTSIDPTLLPSESGQWYTAADENSIWDGSITQGLVIRSGFTEEDWTETPEPITEPQNLSFTEKTIGDYELTWSQPENVQEENPIVKYVVTVQPENIVEETTTLKMSFDLDDLLAGDHHFTVYGVTSDDSNTPTASAFGTVESFVSLSVSEDEASSTGIPNTPSEVVSSIKYEVTTNDFDSYDVSLESEGNFKDSNIKNSEFIPSNSISLLNYDSNHNLISNSILEDGEKTNLTDHSINSRVNTFYLDFSLDSIPFINSGSYSNTVTLSVESSNIQPPNNVTSYGSLKAGSDNVSFNWTAPTEDKTKPIKGYKIFDANTDDLLGIVNKDNTSFAEQGLSRLETRSYKIYAYNEAGLSLEPLVTAPITTAKILDVMSSRESSINFAKGLGWTDVTNINDVDQGSIKIDDYDLVVSFGDWWSFENSDLIKEFFNTGKLALTTGNDSYSGMLPITFSSATSSGPSGGKLICANDSDLCSLITNNSALSTDSQRFISSIDGNSGYEIFSRWDFTGDYITGILFTGPENGKWIHWQTQNDTNLEKKSLEYLLENHN